MTEPNYIKEPFYDDDELLACLGCKEYFVSSLLDNDGYCDYCREEKYGINEQLKEEDSQNNI